MKPDGARNNARDFLSRLAAKLSWNPPGVEMLLDRALRGETEKECPGPSHAY
jgi:hypothetical protein